ncbi:PP2C family protein-serine/threonine phosphatase [Actinoplanes xinjiangensis]|uniref:PP2C family protein-serine/threonine phosphatase n=1 Tax=Actinoplanes xinjiangensis TaxID=512350 RepID=UPI00341FF373
MTSIRAAGGTHVGLVRKRNEDALYQGQWLFAVADGLGGHVAGDVASSTAIDALKPYDRKVEPRELAESLGKAVNDANEALRRHIRGEPQLRGMGTTMVAFMWSGDTAVLANIGDSRAYLLRNRGCLTRISEDHTYQHLLAGAAIVPTLPEKITRFLDGRQDGRSPDVTRHQLHAGDRFVLCSDGLSSHVPHDVIENALQSEGDPAQAVNALIRSALDHGGPDNVTVLVIDVAE